MWNGWGFGNYSCVQVHVGIPWRTRRAQCVLKKRPFNLSDIGSGVLLRDEGLNEVADPVKSINFSINNGMKQHKPAGKMVQNSIKKQH